MRMDYPYIQHAKGERWMFDHVEFGRNGFNLLCEEDLIVNELEKDLDISLIRSEYDNELYCLSSKNNSNIVRFTISNSEEYYYLRENEIIYPKYLISCNIILSLKEEEYISKFRIKLNKKANIKELNFDADEW